MALNENDQGQALPVDDANKTERKFSQYVPCPVHYHAFYWEYIVDGAVISSRAFAIGSASLKKSTMHTPGIHSHRAH